jgi:hypothetical protein
MSLHRSTINLNLSRKNKCSQPTLHLTVHFSNSSSHQWWRIITIRYSYPIREVYLDKIIIREDLALPIVSVSLAFNKYVDRITMWATMTHLWMQAQLRKHKISSRGFISIPTIQEINSTERKPSLNQKKHCKTFHHLGTWSEMKSLKIVARSTVHLEL